jgi:DNA-binding IclR family transcriptional regulator
MGRNARRDEAERPGRNPVDQADQRSNMLERGIQVLQAFRTTEGPLTLSEIGRRTGLPKATVHRLLNVLRELDLVERATDGYVLGRGLFELGELVPIKSRLREAALPYMQDLYEATHETVHLGVRVDLDVLYAEKIRGHSGVDVPSRVGGRLPLSSTGVGKTLLAFSSDDLIAAVLSRPLRRLTDRSASDPRVLAVELSDIRSAGVGYDHEEASIGVSCVAAPVLVHGDPVAALSISVPSSHLHGDRLAVAVKASAFGLARRLSR